MDKIQKCMDIIGKDATVEEATELIKEVENVIDMVKEQTAVCPYEVVRLFSQTEEEKLAEIENLSEEGVELTIEEYNDIVSVLEHIYDRVKE